MELGGRGGGFIAKESACSPRKKIESPRGCHLGGSGRSRSAKPIGGGGMAILLPEWEGSSDISSYSKITAATLDEGGERMIACCMRRKCGMNNAAGRSKGSGPPQFPNVSGELETKYLTAGERTGFIIFFEDQKGAEKPVLGLGEGGGPKNRGELLLNSCVRSP